MNSRLLPTRVTRKQRGQALVELCTAMLIVVPIALVLLNAVFVFIGASLNDFVCRDAARAAAAGAPSVLANGNERSVAKGAAPNRRAVAVIQQVYYSGLPMKVRDLIEMKETVRDVPPQSQGGAIDGEVTVTTTVDIYPPFQVRWAGAGTVVLKARHTVPITYIRGASNS